MRTKSLRLALPCTLAGVLLGAALGVMAEKAPTLPPLTTAPGNPRLPGKFVWADLVTDDVPAATRFYAGLFGWRFNDYGNYLVALHEERPLCGMFQRPRPKEGTGQPRWFGYISVADVAKARAAVTKAGGRVLAEPQQMPRRGEQAVFADPEGAIFGVVKSKSGDPGDFLAEPGDWIWVQLLSRKADVAAEFYRKLAGYEIVENSVTNRISDYVLTRDGYARATVRTIPAAAQTVQPSWLFFVRVANLGESLALTRKLGGKVLIEPKPEALQGKVAVIADPTGAAIGVMEWDQAMVKGAR
jgi:predicted enzyme related to lactoylglutathione lyase